MSEECKGRFYKATTNLFFSKYGSIESRKSLRFLKSISCKGCKKCNWQEDFIKEEISQGNDNWIDDIRFGGIYQLHVDGSYDFEYGWDVCDTYFKKVNS